MVVVGALLLSCWAIVVAVSCKPELADGRFRCDPQAASPCPEGYHCQIRGTVPDYRCYPAGGGFCGDGRRTPEELCEGSDFGGRTCRDYGRWRGSLRCTDTCEIDSSECLGLAALSMSNGRACAVDEAGQVWCWGYDAEGFADRRAALRPAPVQFGGELESIVVGSRATCALDRDGAAWCWGADLFLGIGSSGGIYDTPLPVWGEHRFTELDGGEGMYCGLDLDGGLWCWGLIPVLEQRVGVPMAVPTGQTFHGLAVSDAFVCALDVGDRAWCGGSNFFGSLGNGTTTDSAAPVLVAGERAFLQLATGRHHACGLDPDGQAWCWGLRMGTELPRQVPPEAVVTTPRREAGARRFVALRAGGDLVCGLDGEGAVWCWYGLDPEPWRALSGVEVSQLVVEQNGGAVCGITVEGDARCQGWNGDGGLRADPALGAPQAAGLSGSSVAVGLLSSCGLDSAGGVWCWGFQFLGDGLDGFVPRPDAHPVSSLSAGARALAVGRAHACALDDGGETWCWGVGGNGQLGGASHAAVPINIPGVPRFTDLFAGATQTCGLTAGGQAWCWGGNENGQLGNGSVEESSVPREVLGAHSFESLYPVSGHTLALASDGTVYCFGLCQETSEVLPYLYSIVSTEPVAVLSDARFSAVAGTTAAACGLEEQTGQAWCWGEASRGEVGSGDTYDAPAPAPVAGAQSFVLVRGGSSHFCALDGDGVAHCWGSNDVGQCGTGAAPGADVLAPTPLDTPLRFGELALGHRTSCGVALDDGRVYCWGDNTQGQAGIDAYLYDPTPLIGPDDAP